MPILDENPNKQSYTELEIKKPYIALNSETYINIRHQELAMHKQIGYEFFVKNFLWLDIKLYIVVQVQYILI